MDRTCATLVKDDNPVAVTQANQTVLVEEGIWHPRATQTAEIEAIFGTVSMLLHSTSPTRAPSNVAFTVYRKYRNREYHCMRNDRCSDKDNFDNRAPQHSKQLFAYIRRKKIFQPSGSSLHRGWHPYHPRQLLYCCGITLLYHLTRGVAVSTRLAAPLQKAPRMEVGRYLGCDAKTS